MPTNTRQLQSFQQQLHRTITGQHQLIKTSVSHWQRIFRHVTRCQRERWIKTIQRHAARPCHKPQQILTIGI